MNDPKRISNSVPKKKGFFTSNNYMLTFLVMNSYNKNKLNFLLVPNRFKVSWKDEFILILQIKKKNKKNWKGL